MQEGALLKLIRSFSPVELREVRKFLRSPFFNLRQDLIQLFDLLSSPEPSMEKRAIWEKLFNTEHFDDAKLRVIMSYLYALLEQYIAVKELAEDPLNMQLHTALGFRKRRLDEAFEKSSRKFEKSLREQALRNARYHELVYKFNWETHQYNYPKNPTDMSRLQELSKTADILYLTQKLRLICLERAHRSVYRSGPETEEESWLIERAERPEFVDLPAIAVYLHCYRMLTQPAEEAHFYALKNLLLYHSAFFSEEEMHGLYILALNYCIKELNAGKTYFGVQALDLYKNGLEKGFLYEDGALTRFTYYNVVAAGLQAGDLEWVRFFIHEYKNKLEKTSRESSFSFNLARLEYAEKRYGDVLALLQKANYRDPLLNLSAKTLLVKTYFALDEYETLHSHLDAMRNYIRRKRVLGYHRSNYMNIIRYAEKMLRLGPWDKEGVQKLRQSVIDEPILSEKAFFLKLLEE